MDNDNNPKTKKRTKYLTTSPIVPPYHPTQPLGPAFKNRTTIKTANPRVYLRPYLIGDLEELHALRRQYEVMRWTSTGVIDVDLDATRVWMGRSMDLPLHLPGGDEIHKNGSANEDGNGKGERPARFNFVVVFDESLDLQEGLGEDEGTKGKVIGSMGVHTVSPTPAECGYMLRQEYWGKGIATAAFRALLNAWWCLPRKVIQVDEGKGKAECKMLAGSVFDVSLSKSEIDQSCVSEKDAGKESEDDDDDEKEEIIWLPELLKAEVAEGNDGSIKILRKCGFVYHSGELVDDGPERGMTTLHRWFQGAPRSLLANGVDESEKVEVEEDKMGNVMRWAFENANLIEGERYPVSKEWFDWHGIVREF